MQSFYSKTADEYRTKYLALEKQFTVLEQIQELDAAKQKSQLQQAEQQFFERLAFEKEEHKRRLSQLTEEKNALIDGLKKDN